LSRGPQWIDNSHWPSQDERPVGWEQNFHQTSHYAGNAASGRAKLCTPVQLRQYVTSAGRFTTAQRYWRQCPASLSESDTIHTRLGPVEWFVAPGRRELARLIHWRDSDVRSAESAWGRRDEELLAEPRVRLKDMSGVGGFGRFDERALARGATAADRKGGLRGCGTGRPRDTRQQTRCAPLLRSR
jgi:hypothetical protein